VANPEHIEILSRGVETWNGWRTEMEGDGAEYSFPDLSGGALAGLDLRGVNFGCINLQNANLQEADLRGARLGFANLQAAWLLGAYLCRADLRAANLINANLRDVDLTGTNLIGADATGADFGGAKLEDADMENLDVAYAHFVDCDLSSAKNLHLLEHYGPTSIGLDTIYKSRGKIPESFLRGCGVPESFITRMRSLVNAEDGLQFYSCFISHSTKDAEFATRLHGKMRDAHLRVWYAPEDMPGGKKLHEEIETQIRIYDKLLIVLSEHSLESEWVKTELRKAFQAERESERAGKKKRKLFPVRLTDMERIKAWSCFDADSGKDLGVELREYFIPDFSRWKEHDQFEASFARLLKDLKADESVR
jgi:uncharacterized protein YjbI with pentapeptide repeats